MLKQIIYLLVFLNVIILSQINNPQIYSNNWYLTDAQIKSIKSKINGATIQGKWQCISRMFREPTQCFNFPLPTNSEYQINNQDLVQPETFFKKAQNGQIQGFFWSSDQTKTADRLHLILYREKYRTNQVIQFNFDLNSAPEFKFQQVKNYTKLVLFKLQNLISTVSLHDKQYELVKFDITLDLQIFIQHQNYHFFRSPENQIPIGAPLTVQIISQNISFDSQLSRKSYRDIFYFLFSIALIQSIFIFLNPSASKQNVSKTRTIMFRISEWFILQMYAFIFTFSKNYIKLGSKYFDTDLGYLIYVGLLNIGIGMLFLRKYQMVLQKFTNRWMLFMAMCFVITYFVLAGHYIQSPFFWIIQIISMMLLQILHSMVNGGKGGLPYDLMGFMILSRLPLIYMLSIDNNIYRIPPASTQVLILLFAVFTVLWVVIMLQSKKGGQFMIPNQIIPGYYNYYYEQSSENQNMKQECPICTTQICKSPDSAFQLTQVSNQTNNIQICESSSAKQIQDLTSKQTRFMKTPCGHIFHIDCLTKWMQAKLVCPYCRSTLPQLASLEKQ